MAAQALNSAASAFRGANSAATMINSVPGSSATVGSNAGGNGGGASGTGLIGSGGTGSGVGTGLVGGGLGGGLVGTGENNIALAAQMNALSSLGTGGDSLFNRGMKTHPSTAVGVKREITSKSIINNDNVDDKKYYHDVSASRRSDPEHHMTDEEEKRKEQNQSDRFNRKENGKESNKIDGLKPSAYLKPSADDIMKAIGTVQLTGKLSKIICLRFFKSYQIF